MEPVSVGLKLADWARLAGQWAPKTHLSLPPLHWNRKHHCTPPFSIGDQLRSLGLQDKHFTITHWSDTHHSILLFKSLIMCMVLSFLPPSLPLCMCVHACVYSVVECVCVQMPVYLSKFNKLWTLICTGSSWNSFPCQNQGFIFTYTEAFKRWKEFL